MTTLTNIQSVKSNSDNSVTNYLGILNSDYKKIVKKNFKNYKSNSLFSSKQLIRVWQYNTCCSVETVLKVSLFFIITLFVIA